MLNYHTKVKAIQSSSFIVQIFLIFFTSILSAQVQLNDKYEHIAVLANDSLQGRGYTNNSLKKSANYIYNHFKDYGLKAFDNTYFQTFNHSVNTIDSAEVILNGQHLIFGKDYLISPDTPSASLKTNCYYNLVDILPTNKNWEEDSKVWEFIQRAKQETCSPLINSIDYFNHKVQFYKEYLIGFENYLDSKLIVEQVPKLTHSVSTSQIEVPVLYVNDSLNINLTDTIQLKVHSKLNRDFESVNVIGYIQGSDIEAKTIIISAHYDHLGSMSNQIFNGANDNASGVSMLLHLVEYYSKNKPKNTVVFIAFAGEELGLLGSSYFVQHSPVPLSEIDFVINLDILGTGNEGIKIVNAKKYDDEFKLFQTINRQHEYVYSVQPRDESCNSDHCPFYSVGIPSFYMYTLGGARHYHDIYDTKENLSLYAYEGIYNLLIDFINKY